MDDGANSPSAIHIENRADDATAGTSRTERDRRNTGHQADIGLYATRTGKK